MGYFSLFFIPYFKGNFLTDIECIPVKILLSEYVAGFIV